MVSLSVQFKLPHHTTMSQFLFTITQTILLVQQQKGQRAPRLQISFLESPKILMHTVCTAIKQNNTLQTNYVLTELPYYIILNYNYHYMCKIWICISILHHYWILLK